MDQSYLSEDDLWLLFSFCICWITMGLLIWKSKNRGRAGLISFGLQLIYSVGFFYNMSIDHSFGGGLALWFFFLITLGVHALGNLIVSIILMVRNHKSVKP